MGERPVLFSAPMVRAILAGRKTQTRRVLKPVRGVTMADVEWIDNPTGIGQIGRLPLDKIKPPRFATGDLLWVRENWRANTWNEDGEFRLHYPADDSLSGWLTPDDPDYAQKLMERCSDELERKGVETNEIGHFVSAAALRVRPSIHMPRWASRITLKVTDVKVERLQEISEEDARAEGAEPFTGALHSPGSWEANPWVAAISFERPAPSRDGGTG